MSVVGARVTVTTTATQLSSSTDSDALAGHSVLVKVPTGGATCDVGGSGVTSGAGFRLEGGASMNLDLLPGESLYGIVASGTQVVDVVRSGV